MADKTSTKRKAAARDDRPAAVSHAAPWNWRAIVIVGIAVIAAARPLISETYTAALHGISMALGGGDLSPAVTAMFDLAIVGLALFASIMMCVNRQGYRWTGLEPGALLMVVAAIVSTIFAGDKRVALNASADWLCAVMLVLLIPQVVRSRQGGRLLLAVIVASGAASATKSAMFVVDEHDEMVRQYEESKESFWARQGVALDDPQVELFEKRMMAKEASGFLPFSNAQGSLLVLCGFAAMACGLMRPAGTSRGVAVFLAMVLWGSIWWTQSKGAVIALVAGLMLWVVVWLLRARLVRHSRESWVLFWSAVLILTAVVVIGASLRGGLPTDSLQFRWNYWQVSQEIIADHVWTGTGAHNFDRAYMQHKPIEFPEEINDPHNFVVSVFAQWGVLGLAGLVAMMLGGSWTIFRGMGRRSVEGSVISATEDSPGANPQGISRGWVFLTIPAFLLIRAVLVSVQVPSRVMLELVIFDLGLYGVIWTAAYVLLVLPREESEDEIAISWLLPLAVGVFAFLVHNTIGFSLFVPATLTPWAVMLGVLLGALAPVSATAPSKPRAAAPVAVSGLALFALLILVVIPVRRATNLLHRARNVSPPVAMELYERATQADPLDATAYAELAERSLMVPEPRWQQARQALDAAKSRDPGRLSLHRLETQMLAHRFEMLGEQEDLEDAIAAARSVLELYPESPNDAAALGALLDRGSDQGNGERAREAIAMFRRALELDARRPAEEIRRMPESWRRSLEERTAGIESRLKKSERESPASEPVDG